MPPDDLNHHAGPGHDHAHHGHHGKTAGHDAPTHPASGHAHVIDPPVWSLLRAGLGARLAIAASLSALCWAGILLAMRVLP